MSVHDDLVPLIRAGQQEAKDWGSDSGQYALRIGLHVSPVTGARPFRVDSAELIGFIRNNDPTCDAEANDLAAAIVERFNLEVER